MDAKVSEPGINQAAAEPLSHREKRLIVVSMMLPVFLGSIDQSILATSLPTIGRALGDVHNLPWLITSFLIVLAIPALNSALVLLLIDRTLGAAFFEPSDLVKISFTPADSKTARTVLPAMMPVPGEAGRSKIFAPP